MKAARSLKGRALQYLAQREHSPLELRRKLMPHARAECEAAASLPTTAEPGDPTENRPDATARVEAVMAWLVAHDYLSPERFVETRVHARSARFGNLRIRQEIKQHALGLTPEVAQALNESEFERACAVRARKFTELPSSAVEHARQARFLSGRGFSPEVIRRALREAAEAGAGAGQPPTGTA